MDNLGTNDKINKTEPTQLFENIKNEQGEDVQEEGRKCN